MPYYFYSCSRCLGCFIGHHHIKYSINYMHTLDNISSLQLIFNCFNVFSVKHFFNTQTIYFIVLNFLIFAFIKLMLHLDYYIPCCYDDALALKLHFVWLGLFQYYKHFCNNDLDSRPIQCRPFQCHFNTNLMIP